VPDSVDQRKALVPANKLEKGIHDAKNHLSSIIRELADLATKDFEIDSVTLEIGFSADGKFMGFGVGGTTTIKITVKPTAD